MADILKPEPFEQAIADLTRRINEMTHAANVDCEREEAGSRQWCNDRWQRLHDETRAMTAQRDAMLKAWSGALGPQPVVVLDHNPLT